MSRCQKKVFITFLISASWACAESTTKSSGSCITDDRCICISNLDEFVLHCEGDVHVSLHRKQHAGTFSCNRTMPSDRLSHDYHTLLRLDLFKIKEITFIECPQPSGSYSSLLRSNLSILPSNYPIISLAIDCGARNEFTIERKNFQDMNTLKELRIRCPALLYLANDLFYEPPPKLYFIEISGVKITSMPDMLFSKLEDLRDIEVLGSQIKMLQKDCITGPKDFRKLNFTGNKIEAIDDGIFYDHVTIFEIDLSDNYLSVLPASLENLPMLETLKLRKNFLRKFILEDCSNLSNLVLLDLKDNLIAEIDFECISQMHSLTYFDITGNRILKLPGTPISFENLKYFAWNHNSAKNVHLGEFLSSNSLLSFELRNSSITSLGTTMLQSMTELKKVDLSSNRIKSIPEQFFMHNLELQAVILQENMLSELPQGIFNNKNFLTTVNLRSNQLKNISSTMFARNSVIDNLDLSQNYLQEIPEGFLFGFEEIKTLNFSCNQIKSMHNKLFSNPSRYFRQLDFSNNMLVNLPEDIFSPLNDSYSFRILNLQDNKLVSLPSLVFPKLRVLNLAGNKLKEIPRGAFQKLPTLKQLDLSRNLIREIYSPLISSNQNIMFLDLSSNELQEIPDISFFHVPRLRLINLSNNSMVRFFLESVVGATGLHELNLSNNNMSFFGVHFGSIFRDILHLVSMPFGYEEGLQNLPIKILKLSNNKLNFNYTQLKYYELIGTWGRVSPLVYCKNLEEVYLHDNDIDEIFLDWRVDFPYLRLLDLQCNKFSFITHQEQLFSTVNIHGNGAIIAYNYSRPLVINLKENFISSIELPTSSLSSISAKDKNHNINRSIIFLLGNNPLVCDCRVLNLLMVVNNDASLTGETERTTGKKWVLPAKLDVTNLTCWLPASLKGKRIDEPEEWVHHILPMLGLCMLQEN